MRQQWTDEKQLQEAVRRLAKLLGWLCYHTFDSRRSEPGFPDLVLCKRERLMFRELKVGGRRPTERQQQWLDALTAAGQDAKVWTNADWMDGAIERELGG